MRSSYHRACKYCGDQIQLRQTQAGRWVALDESDKVHNCGRRANRNQPEYRSSKESSMSRAAPRNDEKEAGSRRQLAGGGQPRLIPPASRFPVSGEDIFKDITFPREFVLKSESGRDQGRSARITRPSPSRGKRGMNRRSPAVRASPLKRHRDSGKLSNGRFLFLSLVILLIVLFLWFRLSMWDS
jgi:hypothetical protein